ncbi:helix-turn-helix domain-containing protein [Paenibacillaceae bacterium]|nr:helix-turn-helix domain-containing protein [Paenibacillaceae bacterium]
MRAVDLIQKTRNGIELTAAEIAFLVEGYCRGTIPDYQMAAWSMAVFFRGLSARETADLTMIMAKSGDTVDLSGIAGIKVDKHSTGGVGDKVTPKSIKFLINLTPSMSGNILKWTDDIFSNLKNNFKTWVEKLDKNPFRLHKRTGVSYFQCRMYFNGNSIPTIENIERIAKSYGTDLSQFLAFANINIGVETLRGIIDRIEHFNKEVRT